MKYLTMLLLLMTSVFAQYDCPFGEVNDPYPGDCGRYIDTDNTGYCDHSEPPQKIVQQTADVNELITGQELKTKTVTEVADIYGISVDDFKEKLSEYLGIDISESDSFQLLHDNYGAEPSKVKEIAAALALSQDVDTSKETSNQERYPFLLVAIIITAVYVTSYVLAKKKVIPMAKHKKVWNLILLFSFLIAALSGIYLVLKINYGLTIKLPFNVLWWHVEMGIVMALVAIFHILWHSYYFIRRKVEKN